MIYWTMHIKFANVIKVIFASDFRCVVVHVYIQISLDVDCDEVIMNASGSINRARSFINSGINFQKSSFCRPGGIANQ